MERAYSIIDTKAIDEGRRVFRGIATTPSPDRMLDTINPMGASFQNPIVLLHQHKSDQPIGRVKLGKPTKAGIEFEAEMPVIEEPGPLKDRVDTAWGEIVHGLIRAVSIGFRSLKHSYKKDGGISFEEIEILELSTVSVPALSDASITSIKAIDRDQLAASGRKAAIPFVRLIPPGDSGKPAVRGVKLIAADT